MMVEKIANKSTTVYVYQLPEGPSKQKAVEWLCAQVNSGTVRVTRILLQDLKRSRDEGNRTDEVLAPFHAQDILAHAEKLETDCISLVGKFRNIRLAITLMLDDCTIRFAANNTDSVSETDLEAAFGLE